MELLIEDQVFEQSKYYEETIRKQSRFLSKQISEGQNAYIEGHFNENTLEDETDYLQLGQSLDHTWYAFE